MKYVIGPLANRVIDRKSLRIIQRFGAEARTECFAKDGLVYIRAQAPLKVVKK